MNMTLGEFFNTLSENPTVVCFLFCLVPITAFLAAIFGKEEGAKSPWKELYSVLVYLACIPGIFAITLNVYLFLFERQSIMDSNIFIQILPILSMVLTLWLIRKNVTFDQIPGFGKLGGLIMILATLIVLMWVLEKTNIYIISFMPFHYFILLFIGLIIMSRWGWKKMMAVDTSPKENK